MTILQTYFRQNRDEVLDNLLAFVCDIRPEIHENYRINGQGKEKEAPVPWTGILDDFMEYEALAKLEFYFCEKALSYFCILYSGYLHFLENSKSSCFVQTQSLSKDFVFLPCISQKFNGYTLSVFLCLLAQATYISILTFSFLDVVRRPFFFFKKERESFFP